MKYILFAIILTVFLSFSVSATNYYVSPTGDDGNTGLDEVNAWATIDNGDQKSLLAPGDTVRVLTGTYNISSTITMSISGTEVSPIVYMSEGGPVLITGSEKLFKIEASCIIIDDFEIGNTSSVGIELKGDTCTIRNCYIHNPADEGITMTGDACTILRNIITNCGSDAIVNDGDNNNCYGNTLYSNSDRVIHYKGGVSSGRIFNNIIVGGNEGIRGTVDVACGFNLVWSTATAYSNGIVDSAGGISADPLFVDAGSGDFSLQEGSPAIDAGLDQGYDYVGSAPDMGASEFIPPGGQNYYVSTTGDDGNDGLSPAEAWLTVDNGNQLGVLAPGDTVNILPGTYTLDASIYLTTSGTETDPIVYRKYGEEAAVLYANFSSSAVVYIKSNYINFTGLEVTNATTDGIWVEGSYNVISDCYVHDLAGDAIDIGGYYNTANYNLIIRNLVVNSDEEGIENDSTALNNIYHHNTVVSCDHGLYIYGSTGTSRVFNCIFVNNLYGLRGASGNICGFNDVWSNSLSNYYGGVSDSAGGISAAPLFVDAANDDYRVQPGSPVVDAGLDLGYSYRGLAPDMGAYETGNSFPILAGIGAKATVEGANLFFSVSATDVESTPALTTSTLPSGANFIDNGDGTGDFDWTPTFLQSGIYNVTFYATDDSAAIDSEIVTITVAEAGNQLPVLAEIGAKSVTENDNLTFSVSATDVESTPILTTSTLPTGADFIDNGNGTGDFDWTPTFLQSGIYNVTFYATDDSAAIDSEIVTVTVIEAGNQLPVLAEIGAKSVTENDDLTFSVSATDDESTPALTTSTLPSGANFIDNGDGTGGFEWTPLYPQAGNHEVTFFATDDSSAVDSEIVIITVDSAVLYEIVILPDSVIISADSTQQYSVNGFDNTGGGAYPGEITWGLVDPLGVIDSTGLFDAVTVGITRVTAVSSLGPVDTTTHLEIVPGILAILTVSPDSVEATTDSTVAFTASGVDSDGNSAEMGDLNWDVIDGIGTIGLAGLFDPTTVGTGKVAVTSSIEGVTDTNRVVIVTPGVLSQLVISPDSASVSLGDSVQFSVTGYDADDNITDAGDITWYDVGRTGYIDNNGFFKATAPGKARVAALSSINNVTDTSGVISIEELYLTTVSLGLNYIVPGQSGAVNLMFGIHNYFNSDKSVSGITLRDASRGAGNTEDRLTNVDSIFLYLDKDNDSLLTASDSLLTEDAYDADSVSLSFSPFTLKQDSGYTFIVDLKTGLYPRDGDSLDLFTLPATDIITGDGSVVAGPDTANSYGYTVIDGMVAAQLSVLSSGMTTLEKVDSVYHIMTVDIPRNGYQTDTLEIINIENLGTASTRDINFFYLYRDNGNGVWGGESEDILLGNLAYTGDWWTLSGLEASLAEPLNRFYIAVKLSDYPVNNATIALAIPRDGLEVVSGNDGPKDAPLLPVDTVVIGTTESCQIMALPVLPQGLIPGDTTGPVISLLFTNGHSHQVFFDSLKFHLLAGDPDGATQAELDSQIDSLMLYLEGDENHTVITSDDSLLAVGYLNDGFVLFDVDSLPLSPSGGEITLSATMRMNMANAKNGNTVNLGILDSTDVYTSPAITLTGDFPAYNQEIFTINAFRAEAITVNELNDNTLFGGNSSQLVYDFVLPGNGYASDSLVSLMVKNRGTIIDEEVLSAVSLWVDVTGDGFSVDDIKIDDLTYDGSYWKSAIPDYPLDSDGTRFFITVDIFQEQFEGGTLQFSIPVGGIEYWSGTDGPDDADVVCPTSLLVFPSNRVTVISIPSPQSVVYPASQGNNLLTFALYNGYIDQMRTLEGLNLSNISRSQSGMTYADYELGKVSLYFDTNRNRIFDSDSLLASGCFMSGGMQINGLNAMLPPESLSYFFVVADIPLEVIDNDSLAVSIVAPSDIVFSETANINGDLPLTRGGSLVVDGSVSVQYETIPLLPRTLAPGDTSISLLTFKPPANGNLDDILQSIVIENTQDADSSDISVMELWIDMNDDSRWQSTDSMLGTFTYTDETWQLGLLSLEITELSPVLFVVGDISATANQDGSFQAQIPVNGCQYVSGNDGPIDAPVTGNGPFPISISTIQITTMPINESFSIGQTIAVSYMVTNKLLGTADSVTGEVVSISNPSFVSFDSSIAGPVSLNSGESTEFTFYYTASQAGLVSWQVRAQTVTGPDSSIVISTSPVNIQQTPENIIVEFINSIPSSVTRGQKNVFPFNLNIQHPETASEFASLKFDSLNINVIDGDGLPLSAKDVFFDMIFGLPSQEIVEISNVPDESSVWFKFNNPVFIPAGEKFQFIFIVYVDSNAVVDNFAFSIDGPDNISLVESNTLMPVTLVPSLEFPFKTLVCRIDNPSQYIALSIDNAYEGPINYGQDNVDILDIGLYHPGSLGSSPIQLTRLSFGFVNAAGDTLNAGSVLDRVILLKQQNVAGEITGSKLDETQLTLHLFSPLTINPGENYPVNLAVSVKEEASLPGFRLVIPDSSRFLVCDVNSGKILDVTTDTAALATGSVFPMSSGWVELMEPSQPPELCLSSGLPDAVVGGVDSLNLIELFVSYPVSSEYSSVNLNHVGINVLDSTGISLNPASLFDRIGYRISGGPISYQTFVEFSDGMTVFRFGGEGYPVDPGDSVTLQLVGDIEADTPYDHFILSVAWEEQLSLNDATDITHDPGFVFSADCGDELPFKTDLTRVYLPAGRPSIFVQQQRVQVATPGEEDLDFYSAGLHYPSEIPLGDLVLNGLYGQILKRTAQGFVPVAGHDVFESVRLIVDDEVLAFDNLANDDSLRLILEEEYSISWNDTVDLVLSCDISDSAQPGNYLVSFNDSLYMDVSDKNLKNKIYPVMTSGSYPLVTAEVSISEPNLGNSFVNYPNPFFPVRDDFTRIVYNLPEDAYIDLEIFTVTGHAVKEIAANVFQTAGAHDEYTWSGINGKGRQVAPGTYFCRITARYLSGNEESHRRKVAVIR